MLHRVTEQTARLLGGIVAQYTGDGIMALFGAPIAHEDHAQRPCWAALHLRQRLGQYAHELRLADGLNVSLRIGLNSSEVTVDAIGDGGRPGSSKPRLVMTAALDEAAQRIVFSTAR